MKFKIIPNEQTPAVDSPIWKSSQGFEKFIAFVRRQHNCAGLAANQVSLDGERIMQPFFAIKDDHMWDIIINPKITKYTGMGEEKIEGCLTWIGKDVIALRWPFIDVEYYNLKGDFIKESIVGFKSQIFQHEYNHLMGIPEVVRSRINSVKGTIG